ncbi:hypothetical protein R3P38DRAFT_2805896 [Favolaschia claudopus]|uniref:Uncharacterized protein n=1 Tax=Favolaschia claudopus TaxID=2862362 RepID=A0AAV9ZLT8_9AGAR
MIMTASKVKAGRMSDRRLWSCCPVALMMNEGSSRGSGYGRRNENKLPARKTIAYLHKFGILDSIAKRTTFEISKTQPKRREKFQRVNGKVGVVLHSPIQPQQLELYATSGGKVTQALRADEIQMPDRRLHNEGDGGTPRYIFNCFSELSMNSFANMRHRKPQHPAAPYLESQFESVENGQKLKVEPNCSSVCCEFKASNGKAYTPDSSRMESSLSGRQVVLKLSRVWSGVPWKQVLPVKLHCGWKMTVKEKFRVTVLARRFASTNQDGGWVEKTRNLSESSIRRLAAWKLRRLEPQDMLYYQPSRSYLPTRIGAFEAIVEATGSTPVRRFCSIVRDPGCNAALHRVSLHHTSSSPRSRIRAYIFFIVVFITAAGLAALSANGEPRAVSGTHAPTQLFVGPTLKTGMSERIVWGSSAVLCVRERLLIHAISRYSVWILSRLAPQIPVRSGPEIHASRIHVYLGVPAGLTQAHTGLSSTSSNLRAFIHVHNTPHAYAPFACPPDQPIHADTIVERCWVFLATCVGTRALAVDSFVDVFEEEVGVDGWGGGCGESWSYASGLGRSNSARGGAWGRDARTYVGHVWSLHVARRTSARKDNG